MLDLPPRTLTWPEECHSVGMLPVEHRADQRKLNDIVNIFHDKDAE